MKISVITVVKNDKSNIEKTIVSVKKQNYQNFEHIIVDGCSTDGTSQIIMKHIKSVRYFRKKDKSLYQGINNGLLKVKGDIICLLHSGDIFARTDILKLINQKFKQNYDIISGNILYYENLDKPQVSRIWRVKINDFTKYNFFKIPHTSIFIKKSFLNKIGNYSTKYKISSDADFLLRIGRCKKKYYYFDKYLIFMKSGGISNSMNFLISKIREDIKILFLNFGIFFPIIYLNKIFTKLPGFIFTKKEKFSLLITKQMKR